MHILINKSKQMKILKNIFFVIIALVVIFFAIGFIKSEVNYGSEVTVNKPVQEAWAVSQDETKYTEWLDGFKSMELISGEKFKEGSKYKIIVSPGEGQEEFEMIETIVSVKENDHITMIFDSEFMDFEQTMSFKDNGGSTTITTDSKVIAKGIMTRALFATMEMLGGSFSAQETKNMEALKKLIEENTTDYFSTPVETSSEMISAE